MKQRLSHYKLLLPVIFLVSGPEITFAQALANQTEWINVSQGDWFSASNWNAGVPNPALGAVINSTGTVLLTAPNASADYLWVGLLDSRGGKDGRMLVSKAASGTIGSLRVGHISIPRLYFFGSQSVITGTLNISDGGVVEATSCDTSTGGNGIGIGDGGQQGGPGYGLVIVSGAGSRLSSTCGPLNLGVGIATGTLVIENGGNVQCPIAVIGVATSSATAGSANSVTVKGNGSRWYSYNALHVSSSGGSDKCSLDILSGGFVETPILKLNKGLVRVDNGSTTVEGLSINGSGAEPGGPSEGQLVVGDHTAGRMAIRARGLAATYRGFIGSNVDGVGSVLVDNGRWKATGSIWVGNAGNGTLDVLFGGTVTSTGNGYLGFENNSAGYATIDGTNSAWTMNASLFIGGNGLAPGGFGQLVIQNGGVVGAAGVTLWNRGHLVLGANATLNGPLTARGGTIGTGNNITLAKNFTLGAEGVVIQTNGFNSTFSGVISGSGGLTKGGGFTGSGPGTLTLTAQNTYTGPTVVSFGKLVVDGRITSAVTVNGNGILSGNGIVGDVTVTNSGIIAPGHSPGKLTVFGNYTQQSGGVLNVEIGGATPGTEFDQVAVSGNASVNGILNLSLVNGYKPTVGQTFPIITSGSATGNFSTINSSGFTVRSDVNNAGVVLTVTSVVPGVPVITSSTSASGTQDQPFSYQITATESPTSFGATGLPPGLSVNPGTGVISGTPTTAGSFDVTISATNSTATGSATLTITVSAPPPPTPAPTRLANISTRLRVETDDNVLFGGFIITGTQPKKLIVRAIGPSVPVAGRLEDPTLELYSGPTLLAANDNWMDSPEQQAIIDSTIPPANNLESAIVRSLAPGSYTTIVRGVNQSTGVGLVEIYDLDANVDSKLAQISTRGFVQTGDDAMFGGLYVVGGSSQTVIVRAIGPSLSLLGKLEDPTLELYDGNGTSLGANDNWRTGGQEAEIIATTVPPSDNLESAIVRTFAPGPYTAIVRGVNNTTGIALVEVYALN